MQPPTETTGYNITESQLDRQGFDVSVVCDEANGYVPTVLDQLLLLALRRVYTLSGCVCDACTCEAPPAEGTAGYGTITETTLSSKDSM